jgi:hypothetical protein
MKKVWASSGESEAKSRSLVKSRVAGGGSAGSASARKTPTRYPLPSAEEIPEIEPTAGIDVGSGGYDGVFASGETAHDHVVAPSGPGGGANAPGGPPTHRWKCTSSSLRTNCTVPAGTDGDAGHRRWEGHAGRCGPASATRGSRRIGDTSAEDVRGASDFDRRGGIASRRLDHRSGGSRPRPHLRDRALRARSRQHARRPHDGEEQEGRWSPQPCRHARPLAYGDPLAAHARAKSGSSCGVGRHLRERPLQLPPCPARLRIRAWSSATSDHSERPVLAGTFQGGAPNMLLAATHPERVHSLVWDHPQARSARAED